MDYRENVEFKDEGDIPLEQYLKMQTESIVNIIFSHDGTLALALVVNLVGSREKIIVAQIGNFPSKTVIFIKNLSQSISKLEMITLDNKYLITKRLK